MQKAIVKVMLEVVLDVDTDRPVVKLDESVYSAIQYAIRDHFEDNTLEINKLGHYVDTVSVTAVRLLA